MSDTHMGHIADDDTQGLRRAVEELMLLNDLALAISSTLDLDEIIAVIVTRATKAIGADQVVLTMVNRDELVPAGTVFRTTEHEESELFHLTRNLLGCMAHECRALLINDVANDPLLKGIPLASGVRNLLCVPLNVGPELIAVLSACNKLDGGDFKEDDQRLLAIMASQSAQVLERARLLKEEEANAQLKKDILVAESIQSCLLPDGRPEISGYDVAGASVAARSVGGDYFDFIPLSDDRWGVVLGDVSGKGVPAALLMSNLQAMLRGQAPLETNCRKFIHSCNKQFFFSTPVDKFATLFYGALDTQNHVFSYCNAGHERPFFFHGDEEPTRLCTGGLAIGVIPEADYADESIDMQPGDMMVIYSDGVTDVVNSLDEPFGEDCLLDILMDAKGQTADELVTMVKAAVEDHAGGEPAFDDVTLVIVKRDWV